MRVAIIEASHWHVPLYLDALDRPDVDVVAISDEEGSKGAAVAQRFGAKQYESYSSLIDEASFDMAIAFGRHSEMPRICDALIVRGTPFSIEKPCGLNAEDVAKLEKKAAARGTYVAVPFILRLSDLLKEIRNAQTTGSRYQHMAFRFIAGDLARYEAAGSGWMLDRTFAGGGCTINLAVHFIDLVSVLTNSPIVSVSARMSKDTHDVEIYSVMTLTTAEGMICTIETGYTFPKCSDAQREFSFSLSSSAAYLQSGNDSIIVRSRSITASGTEIVNAQLNTDNYYGVFVERMLCDIANSAAPVANLTDLHATMRVIDAAYESAENEARLVRL